MTKIDMAIDKARKDFSRILSRRQKATGQEFERLHLILIQKEELVHKLEIKRKLKVSPKRNRYKNRASNN